MLASMRTGRPGGGAHRHARQHARERRPLLRQPAGWRRPDRRIRAHRRRDDRAAAGGDGRDRRAGAATWARWASSSCAASAPSTSRESSRCSRSRPSAASWRCGSATASCSCSRWVPHTPVATRSALAAGRARAVHRRHPLQRRPSDRLGRTGVELDRRLRADRGARARCDRPGPRAAGGAGRRPRAARLLRVPLRAGPRALTPRA